MAISRRLSLTISVFLLLLTSHNAQQPPLPSSASDRARTSQGDTRDQPARITGPSEQEWIARDVSTAIQQMVSFARSGGSPGNTETTIVRPWAPESYLPLAKHFAGSAPCAVHGVSGAVRTLVNPRPDVLVSESERISKRLQNDMSCADAHHEAALLLGAFAMRETAGRFTDPRRVISRMTAHLAVAEAAQPNATSLAKGLAYAVLLTLTGRQRDALAALGTLESGEPAVEVQAWIRALRLRNTLDWRPMHKAVRLTMLEQFALLRALDMSLGNNASLERFDEIEEPADVADWPRLLLHWNPGVVAGNRFTEYWIASELAEFAGVLHATESTPASASSEALIAALNAEPADGPVGTDGVVRVIDRGTWAAAAQRHILMAVVARHKHLVGALGLKEDARAFRDQASRSFSALSLYPLAAAGFANSREEVVAIFPRVTTLVRTRPELVTDHVWRTLQARAQYAALPPPRDAGSWFRPFVPPGTAFDVESRGQPDGTNPRLTKTEVAQLREHAPYSRRLAIEAVRWRGGATYETLREEYGDLPSHDLEFATAIAKAAWDRPEIYVPMMERVCAMDPDEGYWELAPYLVDHGRIDEGRRAYERWLSRGRSPVSISNSMMWLVRHYHERGEHEKAEELADRVAEVGSYWGLVTRASLHDWQGEFEDAELLYRRAWKRYDRGSDLLAFYLRNDRKGPEVLELTREIFPAGLTRTGSTTVAAAPRDGALVTMTGVVGADAGLKVNDVIVAVDGIRVRNDAQYRAAWGASKDDTVKLTFWRGGKYMEVAARLRHRWIVSWVETYRPGPLDH